MLTFEIFQRTYLFRKPRWFFRLKAQNGEIIAQSEGYVNRTDCIETVHLIKLQAMSAFIKLLENGNSNAP